MFKAEYYFDRANRGKSETINSKVRLLMKQQYEHKITSRDESYPLEEPLKTSLFIDLRPQFERVTEFVEKAPKTILGI